MNDFFPQHFVDKHVNCFTRFHSRTSEATLLLNPATTRPARMNPYLDNPPTFTAVTACHTHLSLFPARETMESNLWRISSMRYGLDMPHQAPRCRPPADVGREPSDASLHLFAFNRPRSCPISPRTPSIHTLSHLSSYCISCLWALMLLLIKPRILIRLSFAVTINARRFLGN
jgi:hypothetical protein